MHPKSIETVSDSYLCCNCGACKVVCPKNAIKFKMTSIGRFYADVNENCIDCGLCTKVCPTLVNNENKSGFDPFIGNISSVYVGKSLNQNIFLNSQSGGICTSLLKYLFDTQKIDAALVCRMKYGNPIPEVMPVFITSPDDLYETQKSCYSPVVLLDNLKEEIKKYASIAVVGIGCHLEGLSNIESLRSDIKEKIFCKIGLICDRTLCNTIQNVYASYTAEFNERLINWKCKYLICKNIKYSYKDAPLVISDKKSNYKQFPNYYRFVLKDIFTPPRCRICPNKLNIYADVTLGDPWRMSDIDMENGESVIAVRTQKGENIIKSARSAQYIAISDRPIDELIKGQLTDIRKIQVAEYVKAFHIMQPKVSSKLLLSDIEIDSCAVDKASRCLSEFKEREAMSSDIIVKKARNLIFKAKLKASPVYRILRKIFEFVKK